MTDIPTRTYRAAVRFKDGRSQKFDVCDVPIDLDTVRAVIHRDLAAEQPALILIVVPKLAQTKQAAA